MFTTSYATEFSDVGTAIPDRWGKYRKIAAALCIIVSIGLILTNLISFKGRVKLIYWQRALLKSSVLIPLAITIALLYPCKPKIRQWGWSALGDGYELCSIHSIDGFPLHIVRQRNQLFCWSCNDDSKGKIAMRSIAQSSEIPLTLTYLNLFQISGDEIYGASLETDSTCERFESVMVLMGEDIDDFQDLRIFRKAYIDDRGCILNSANNEMLIKKEGANFLPHFSDLNRFLGRN